MAKPVKKNPGRMRARFNKEFKLEAVRLLESAQKPATQLAYRQRDADPVSRFQNI